jgi:hypothetical protein
LTGGQVRPPRGGMRRRAGGRTESGRKARIAVRTTGDVVMAVGVMAVIRDRLEEGKDLGAAEVEAGVSAVVMAGVGIEGRGGGGATGTVVMGSGALLGRSLSKG